MSPKRAQNVFRLDGHYPVPEIIVHCDSYTRYKPLRMGGIYSFEEFVMTFPSLAQL